MKKLTFKEYLIVESTADFVKAGIDRAEKTVDPLKLLDLLKSAKQVFHDVYRENVEAKKTAKEEGESVSDLSTKEIINDVRGEMKSVFGKEKEVLQMVVSPLINTVKDKEPQELLQAFDVAIQQAIKHIKEK